MKTEYEIVEARNNKAIPVFAEMAVKMKDCNYKREDMLTYFEGHFGLPDFKVFVEPHLYGMMAVNVLEILSERYLHIELLYTDPNHPKLTEQFIKVAENLGREWGLAKLRGTVRRQSLMRRYTARGEEKYGFLPEAIIIVKDISGGSQ